MIIVKYTASGMKSVVGVGVSGAQFWLYYRAKRNKVNAEHSEEIYISNQWPKHAFEIVDERLADGCDRYVGRPDDWPIIDYEPY